jgi:hypothetical protein
MFTLKGFKCCVLEVRILKGIDGSTWWFVDRRDVAGVARAGIREKVEERKG